MKLSIVILLFISVAWARTLTETEEDPAKPELESFLEEIDEPSRSEPAYVFSATHHGKINDQDSGTDEDCSGVNPSPTACPDKTTSGQCCSIPFSYMGVTYNNCTQVDHHRPWCSLDPVYKGRWGNCLKATTKPTACPEKTTSGQCCSIPFSYKGVRYSNCTQVDHHRPWCSLDPVYRGRWGNCLIPTPTACPEKTTSGQCCSIPFSYKGVRYSKCTQVDHHRSWCSLDPVYKGRWGNCQV